MLIDPVGDLDRVTVIDAQGNQEIVFVGKAETTDAYLVVGVQDGHLLAIVAQPNMDGRVEAGLSSGHDQFIRVDTQTRDFLLVTFVKALVVHVRFSDHDPDSRDKSDVRSFAKQAVLEIVVDNSVGLNEFLRLECILPGFCRNSSKLLELSPIP